MKNISFSFLLLLLFLSPLVATAQDNQAYVIQLATYGSWEDFAQNEAAFYTNTGTADNNIFAEEVNDMVKVYLLDSYQGGVEFFYPGDHLQKVLNTVRKNSNFKGAFKKGGIDFQSLTYYGDVFEKYRNITNGDQLTKKGGALSTSAKDTMYKIQLGVFKEWRSLDDIAKRYSLNQVDSERATNMLSHDFIKVKDQVCRRYYYGEYSSKAAALEKLKALEKASKRKLILVEI